MSEIFYVDKDGQTPVHVDLEVGDELRDLETRATYVVDRIEGDSVVLRALERPVYELRIKRATGRIRTERVMAARRLTTGQDGS